MAGKNQESKLVDYVDRHNKDPAPLAKSIFVGLRAADAALQFCILQRGWGTSLIQSLGASVVPFATPRDPSVAFFGLGPYPAIIAALAAGSSMKHIIHTAGIGETAMTPGAATSIAMLNSVASTLNTLFSIWAVTSAAPQMATQSASLSDVITSSPTLMFGLGLYTVGICTELGSEVQRKAFKAKPENKGKPYGGGLFSLATNINYGGYILWRAGYATAAAGLPWGAFVGALAVYDFTTRAIPVLDQYCTERVCNSHTIPLQRVFFVDMQADLSST